MLSSRPSVLILNMLRYIYLFFNIKQIHLSRNDL